MIKGIVLAVLALVFSSDSFAVKASAPSGKRSAQNGPSEHCKAILRETSNRTYKIGHLVGIIGERIEKERSLELTQAMDALTNEYQARVRRRERMDASILIEHQRELDRLNNEFATDHEGIKKAQSLMASDLEQGKNHLLQNKYYGLSE